MNFTQILKNFKGLKRNKFQIITKLLILIFIVKFQIEIFNIN